MSVVMPLSMVIGMESIIMTCYHVGISYDHTIYSPAEAVTSLKKLMYVWLESNPHRLFISLTTFVFASIVIFAT